MTARRADTPVLVFARAPQAGAAKTRLIPALGAAGAAALHARLVERTLATACAARLGPVELHCAPDTAHPFFAACAARHGVRLVAQCDGDLGARMHAAFARALETAANVLLIGSDCPALERGDLRAAAQALHADDDVVLVPAEDGGYVLIGLRAPQPALFDDMPWSAPHLLASTRARLHARGLRWRELAPRWDLDRPDDLARLRELSDWAA